MTTLRTRLALALLTIGFFGSVAYVLSRDPPSRDQHVTLRLGHWLMHSGMREAFAEAGRRYELLHPEVRIEQNVVPIRSYPAWLRTQLIGGTAPDIIGMFAVNAEIINRYFLPLNDVVLQPNPYNVGTPLAGVPWRNTFADGLESIQNMSAATGQIGAITLQLNTYRLFTNVDLLRRVTGQTTPPETFAALQALGPLVETYNATHAVSVTPIAGCGPYLRYVNEQLLASQTQKLAVALSPMRTLKVGNPDLALMMLDGRAGLEEPAVQSTFELLREVTNLMPPGVEQLQRDDALFMFLQGKAVTFIAGSWDYGVLAANGNFTVAVDPIPIPTPDDPRFGPFVLGPISEAAVQHEAPMAVFRDSAHPALAIDFLQFLSSPEIATLFSEMSQRTSAVIGVPPPAGAGNLAPRLEGEPAGLSMELPYFGGRNAFRVMSNHHHLLFGPGGSTAAFIAGIRADLPPAIRDDVQRHLSNEQKDAQRSDALIGLMLTHPGGVPDTWRERIETQHQREGDALRVAREVAATP